MKLKKDLGVVDVFAISTGAMISSGIFILPGIAFNYVGPALFVSYFFAGLLALTGAFSIAEVSSAMPKAGGDYFITKRSLGPLAGTIAGLLSWFALSLKTAFAIIGIAEILRILFQFPVVPSGLTICAVFTIINLIGVKEAGRFEIVIVFSLLAICITYVVFGLFHVNISRFEPFAPQGVASIFSTAGFVFVSYGGILKVVSVAEEVKNPKRNLPLGIFSSLFVVIALYGLLLIVTIGTLDASILGTSSTAIADSARTFMGKPGFIILTIAAMLAFVSTANAGILAASRYPFALSRDSLLPSIFAKVHPKTHTPFIAILLTSIFISLAIIIPLELLVKAASAVIILTYILLHTTIIILRESNIQNYQPSFTSPFYPWNQLIGLAAFCVLLIKMGTGILLTSFALICVGMFVYFLHGRFRASKEFALMHLVARIMNKEIQNSVLEKELKLVLQHRDEISYDRFDHLVEDADLIDIKEKINLEDLMEIISNDIENKVHIKANNINQLLHERERDSSTAITPFVAIPHLIVEGEKIFELLIIRVRKGIYFSEVSPSVKAIFVLYGSKGERTFHLQALASIAQIIQTAHFDELWLKAKQEANLKDILLLADRRRFH